MIPLNDTSRISDTIIQGSFDNIHNMIKSGRWLLGQYTEKFSFEFSKYIGTKYCLPVANGTDALEIALRAVCYNSIPEGEVITVANAGGYTSTACQLVGVKPIYIDINNESLLLDIRKLATVLSNNTLAIVITHLYGRAVDVIEVREELNRLGYNHVKIIEDCAQAHGAEINNQKVGSLGDISTFSFYPTKNLGTVGDAGAILTSNNELYQLTSKISQYGWNGKYNIEVGFSRNSRMDEIQAIILLDLLSYLDRWNERRREIYKRYIEAGSSGICFFSNLTKSNVVHLAIVKVKKRNEFILHMNNRGISADIHYPILDIHQQAWKKSIISLPSSESILNEIVTLPCFPTMTDSEIEAVCEALRSW